MSYKPCYHPSRRDGWRDTDCFKTCVPGQTRKRAHFSQSGHGLHRPTPARSGHRRLSLIFMVMRALPGPCETRK
jgi:hypothetical protein